MASIPGRKPVRFYERKLVVEIVSNVPPILAAIVTAAVNFRDPEKIPYGWASSFIVLWLIGAAVVKILYGYSQDKEKKEANSYYGELGAVYTIYNVVARYNYKRVGGIEKEPPTGWFRVTFHRVIFPEGEAKYPEEYEQLLPYAGGVSGDGGAGRKFSIRSGIVGRTIREKSAFAASRINDNYEEYIHELVHEWAYPEHDARALKSDRQSWMAVPIFGSKKRVIGVVYLDSVEREFFTDDVKQLVIDACYGLTSYIKERYKSS